MSFSQNGSLPGCCSGRYFPFEKPHWFHNSYCRAKTHKYFSAELGECRDWYWWCWWCWRFLRESRNFNPTMSRVESNTGYTLSGWKMTELRDLREDWSFYFYFWKIVFHCHHCHCTVLKEFLSAEGDRRKMMIKHHERERERELFLDLASIVFHRKTVIFNNNWRERTGSAAALCDILNRELRPIPKYFYSCSWKYFP